METTWFHYLCFTVLLSGLVDFTDYPNISVDYFAIDETVLRDTVNELARIASLNQIAQVGSKIALSIEKVKEYTGNLNETIDLTNVNWATDFNSIVDMYAEFKKLGYKSMDDFKAKEWNKQLETILNDEQKYENVKVVLTKLVGLDLYNAAGGEAIQNVLNKMFSKNAPKFENILELTGLTADQWQEDINGILEIAKAASDINALESFNPFDYKNLDLVSDEAVEKLKLIVDRALALNILGNDEIKNNIIYSLNPPKIRELKRHTGYMGYEYLRYTLTLSDSDITNLIKIKENKNGYY